MLILGIFSLILVSAISSERINGITITRTAALILIYSGILAFSTLNVGTLSSGIGLFGGLYNVTLISRVIECFMLLLGAVILINTTARLSNNAYDRVDTKAEYSIIALFSLIGGILLLFSNDLISMYLSIELQSFGLYSLATIYRDSQSATYGGLKYFLLGGLSSGFILLGSAIIYAYLGVTNLESIYILMSANVNNLFVFNINMVSIGIIILIVGFLFKVSAAPFHNWSPDVYDGVPTKVTTWLAIMAKLSIFIFILQLVSGTTLTINNVSEGLNIASISNLILIAALLSLLIGTIVGLAQSRIKRLLAYSTISHVGFLLLSIAINTEDSIESFIFYLIQYSLTSANAFFVLLAFSNYALSLTGDKQVSLSLKESDHSELYSPVQLISQLRGVFNNGTVSTLLALSLSIILFSMAGIPPLVGFFAKQAVLLSAVKNGYVFLALVGIITSVISAAYYLRIIKVMIFETNSISSDNTRLEDNSFVQEQSVNESQLSNSMSFSIALLTVLTVFFLLKPILLLNGAHIMALSMFYT